MNDKKLYVILILSVVFSFGMDAQDSDAEDVFELSPFTVSSSHGRGYRATSTLAGSRVRTQLRDVGGSLNLLTDGMLRDLPNQTPRVSVTMVKPADELSMRFAVSFYDDMEDVRESSLLNVIDRIRKELGSSAGLRFEPGQLIIAKGDRKKALRKRRSEYTSHVHFTIYSSIQKGVHSFDIVRRVKELLDGLDLETEMLKIFDGPVNLVVKRPDASRADLLRSIFADYEGIKEGLGSEFQVMLSGLGSKVELRPYSDTEVELWIPYGIQIRSRKELELETTRLLLSQR